MSTLHCVEGLEQSGAEEKSTSGLPNAAHTCFSSTFALKKTVALMRCTWKEELLDFTNFSCNAEEIVSILTWSKAHRK